MACVGQASTANIFVSWYEETGRYKTLDTSWLARNSFVYVRTKSVGRRCQPLTLLTTDPRDTFEAMDTFYDIGSTFLLACFLTDGFLIQQSPECPYLFTNDVGVYFALGLLIWMQFGF